MGAHTDTVKKIRTFHSDMERVKPSPKVNNETKTIEPTKIPTPLPSVFNAKKPTPEVITITPPPNKKEVEVLPETSTVQQAQPIVQKEPQAPALLSTPKTNVVSKEMSDDLGALANTVAYNPSDKLNVMDTDSEITEGTIITDKKRERFKLLPAMIEAVKSWFSEGKEEIERRVEKKRLAVPTVTTIEERKDIVQMAARQTAQAPKDDYKKLTAKLPKNLGKDTVPAKPSLVISKKEPEAKPGWSHYEGQEAKTIAPVVAATEAVKSPEMPTAPPVIPALTVKAEEPKPTPAPVATPKEVKVEPVSLTIKDKPATSTPRKWKETPKPRRFLKLSRAVFYVAIVFVSLGAMTGGVMLTMWFFGANGGLVATTPTSSVTSEQAPKPTLLLPADRETEILLPRTRALFYESILSNSQNLGGINVIIPTLDNVGSTRASTSDLLETLDWQTSSALLRAITEMNFGTLGTSPFIVIRVTSFDTALGGLLVAEDNLDEDLSPLFGEPVAGTFNVTEDASEVRPAYFEDDVVRNHDVRVLKDELEKERIVYGFVNQNTVVITTDRGTFAAIAEAIR